MPAAALDDSAFARLRAASPAAIFAEWFAAAAAAVPQPEAATLATADADGMPQARTVLVKSFAGGKFVFFTNSESRKGEALRGNPRAALLFYWPPLGRQASAEGVVKQISRKLTKAYFITRPPQSRIGAWASAQSRPIESPAAFDDKVRAAEKECGETSSAVAKMDSPPPHWNGYALTPLRMEFWLEGEHRLHRRLAFSRAAPGQKWRAAFLQP